MLILLTGGTGSIGKQLTDELMKSGYNLRILSRNSSAKERKNIEYISGDLNNIESLASAVKGVDAIIHLAGITHTNDTKLYYAINTEGTRNLIKACQINNANRFIYISSRTACLEGGAYAKSKYIAEELVKASGLKWTILRPSEVYGAEKKEAIENLAAMIKKYPVIPIIGNGRYSLSPVHIDDLVQCIIAALNNNASFGKTYTVAGPEEFTFNQIVDKISNIYHVKRVKIFIPITLLKFIAFLFGILKMNTIVRDQIPRLLCKKSADISPAREDLKFNPRKIEEGLNL